LRTEPDIRFQPARPGDIRTSVGDPMRAGQALGCAAKVTVRQGLARTLTALQAGQSVG